MSVPPPDLTVEVLSAHHDRDGFACGVDSLDLFRFYQRFGTTLDP